MSYAVIALVEDSLSNLLKTIKVLLDDSIFIELGEPVLHEVLVNLKLLVDVLLGLIHILLLFSD